MSSEKVYSRNGEEYYDLDTVIDDLRDCGDYEVGYKAEIFEADLRQAKHSDFISAQRLIEDLQERAYDNHGEWSECYLEDVSEEKIKELEKLIISWFDLNAKKPTFYSVENDIKIQVVID